MSKGLVIREGAVPLNKVINYAKKNKLPIIDLRNKLSFANIEQLNNHLSLSISKTFRRPIRTSINDFLNGSCRGKPFVAIIPHDFITDLLITTKQLPKEVITKLTNNESMLA